MASHAPHVALVVFYGQSQGIGTITLDLGHEKLAHFHLIKSNRGSSVFGHLLCIKHANMHALWSPGVIAY